MYFCSAMSREWKVNTKTVLNTISLLFIFFVSANNVWGRITIRAGSLLDLPLVSTDPNSEPLRPGKFEKFTATAFRSNPHPYQLAPGIATDPKFGYIEFSATGDAKLPLFTNPKKDCSSSRDKSSVTRSIRYKWDEPGAYTVTAQIFDENGNRHASVDWHVQVGELTFELLPDLPLNPSTPDAPSVQVAPEPGHYTARVGSDMHFDIQASSDDGIASITLLLYEDGSASSQLIQEKDGFLFRRGLFGLSPPSLTAVYTWRTLGTHRVAAQIVTEAGGFREVTWRIKVEGRNLPPTPIADTSLVDLGTLVVGGEPGIAYVSEYFSDPEGERLAFDTVTADAATPNLVTLRVLEDSHGYKNRIAIEPERPGRAVFHAIAREREGLLSAQSFTVLVEPQHAHAPTEVDPIPAQTLTMDQTLPALDLSTHFRDPNAKRLTYTVDVSNSAIALPQVAGSQLSIWALSIGSTPVTVRATNPEGLYAEQAFEVTVTETSVQQPPEEEPSSEETYVPVEDATIVRPPAPDEDTYVPVEDAVIVRPTASPDLRVESIEADKTTLDPGERFEIETRIWNQGRATSSTTTLRYYLSTDETISPAEDTEVGSDRVDALSGRGASASRRRVDLSQTLIAPDTPGTHYYGVCIDAAGNESNTSNNCSQAIAITVEAPPPDPADSADPVLIPRPEAPDLVISAGRVDRSTIKQGAGVRLHITLTNRGMRAAPATTIRYYRSLDATISAEDTELRAVPVGGLGPGKSYTTWALLPSPFAVGVFYYGACLDAVESEFDTTNNCSSAFKITIGAQGGGTQGLYPSGTIETQSMDVGGSPVVLDVSGNFVGKVESYTASSSDRRVVTAVMSGSEVTLTPVREGWSAVTIQASSEDLAAKLTFYVSVGGVPIPEFEVVIPDANLRAAVRSALELAEGDTLTEQRMLGLITLSASGASISNLTGLEYATVLRTLNLGTNHIQDLTPLENLRNLADLILWKNEEIQDLTPLQNLTSLRRLALDINKIRDLTPLENLRNLADLSLGGNQVTNVYPLRNLKNLKDLWLVGNQISDVTPLEGLTSLKELWLGKNPIGDLAPLRRLKEKNPSLFIDINIDPVGGAPSVPVFPAETALLSNYPNPFNPETWIPYQLAKSADVTLTIYDVRGVMVRRLALGHRPAGFYRSRGRAAHWDGRNQIGEKVATGLYFYTLTAGEFNATGKMLIQK